MDFSVYDINPVPKPRQTQSAKWKKKPCDERYYQFKDEIKLSGISVSESGAHVLFVLKMPLSWSGKKKTKMNLQPHKQRPDIDNLEKALFDACFKEDSHIWDCRCSKVWGYEGKIIIVNGIGTDWILEFLNEVL